MVLMESTSQLFCNLTLCMYCIGLGKVETSLKKGGGGSEANERKEFSVSVLTLIHGPLLCIYDTSAREGRATCVFKHDSNVCFHMYSHGFIVIIDSLCKEIHVKP